MTINSATLCRILTTLLAPATLFTAYTWLVACL